MPLTGVAGWPVAHSRSPVLHRAAFSSLGLSGWESQLLPIPPELFEETVRALPASGFVGINVTIPHKEAALRLADIATEESRLIGAANTLSFTGEGILAANTDAPAIREALRDRVGDSPVASALVLGAGGSARAAVRGLQTLGVERINVHSRTHARSKQLASELGCEVAQGIDPADILVNCTPVGLDPSERLQLEALGLSDQLVGDFRVICDLVYATRQTELIKTACERRLETIDGIEILARQGALSVEIWTEELPDWSLLGAAVRKAD